MEYLLIGKYVNTHGIKGEIKIKSDFRYKDLVFKKGISLYLGNDKREFIVRSHRLHKGFDMVTFNRIDNINDIEMLKGSNIYINKEDLELSDEIVLIEDLIRFDVYIDNINIGKVIEIINSKANGVLVVSTKRILIPYVKEFILNIDQTKKRIDVKNVKGLME